MERFGDASRVLSVGSAGITSSTWTFVALQIDGIDGKSCSSKTLAKEFKRGTTLRAKPLDAFPAIERFTLDSHNDFSSKYIANGTLV